MKEKDTPLTRQYNQIKAKYPESILLFRLGDFFETFNDDAVITAKVCGITLTKRNNGAAGDMPLAGFPHHQIDNYLPKLVRAGYRVAVCDQLEDPKNAKGIVRRGVVEVVTPGVAVADKLLETKENNYVLSLYYQVNKNRSFFGIAFADVSTGEFSIGEIDLSQLNDVVETISPKEILISREQKDILIPILENLKIKPVVSKLEDWFYDFSFALELLLRHFQVSSLKGYGVDSFHNGIVAAGALLHFVKENQQGNTEQINSISAYNSTEFMILDYTTRKNLEILFNINQSQAGNTLLSVIDKTQTPMGGRLLKHWLNQPLISIEQINIRLEAVDKFYNNKQFSDNIRALLSKMGDLERLISKVSVNKANPRDYINLKLSLLIIPKIIEEIEQIQLESLLNSFKSITFPSNLIDLLENAILDEPSVMVGVGRIFKKNYNPEVDEYSYLKYSAKEWLNEYQEKERQRTQIQSLKVGFNGVFGYYIDVSKANTSKVPSDYERRQTLTNSERYITPELKEFETKILDTESKLLEIEQKLLEEIRQKVLTEITPIQQLSKLVAELDCLTNFAIVSIENNYTKPIIDDSKNIEIAEGRHPVLEKSLKIGAKYTSNSTLMNDSDEMIHIITGPNMSGKSSYLRQVGLIVFLGQIGCFVPAKSAKFGLVDKIFTRVGASDNITSGESTFLVEMQESANILNNATSRSLVLLDEVGRGTATFDGISIAWAIAEYLHNILKTKTIFATHYHELKELSELYSGIKNYKIEVIEAGKDIIFTHKLGIGASDNSFGIHVAKMAGLPKELTSRAEEILSLLDSSKSEQTTQQISAKKADTKQIKGRKIEPRQLSIFEFKDDEIREKLRGIDPTKVTPIEAMQILFELKQMTK